MIKVGLTGGIGSGKSFVRKIFEHFGIQTYDADFEAKQLINNSADVISKIKASFGENIYLSNGQIDKMQLSQLIFQDKNKLKTINNIVHPAVKVHFNSWCEGHKSAPYIIKEAAILFESGAFKQVDKIISVTAPEQLRIARVLARDKITEAQIRRRINAQMTDKERTSRSDYEIVNAGKTMLLEQVLKIHKAIMQI